MTEKQIGVAGIAASIVPFILSAIALIIFDKLQRPYWVVILLLIAFLPGIILLGRRIWRKLRPVRFVDSFGKYCDECRSMLERASDHDEVFTIQTPVSLRVSKITPEDVAKYEQYISYTIVRLIASELQYHRVVVLKSHDAEPKEKIKDFVRRLVDAAVAHEQEETNTTKKVFHLSNVSIGFVDSSRFGDDIYGNLDIHITTDTDFSVAFLNKSLVSQEMFGGSLHLRDGQRRVSRRLRNEMVSLWGAIQADQNFIDLGRFYLPFDGQTVKTGAQKAHIVKTLNTEIDCIADKAK
jgi:hypothetical protein